MREQEVEVFNKLMNQPIALIPEDCTLKNRQLGVRLIFSELEELARESGVLQTFRNLCHDVTQKGEMAPSDSDVINKVGQLDGLCDVQYTLSWAVNVFGFSKNFDKAFLEVCRSNNSKACNSPEEAEATKAYWENSENHEGGGEHHIEPVSVPYPEPTRGSRIYYVVKRTSDGKVRKSVNYSPAQLELFV